ncbi:hypothetical protein [Micrococcoides hystricis]|uniref:Lipoprotein n=1 Tax=Micrococcoides hystricis TaxID=1572761 RepID=A0ABV6PC98_9MICC
MDKRVLGVLATIAVLLTGCATANNSDQETAADFQQQNERLLSLCDGAASVESGQKFLVLRYAEDFTNEEEAFGDVSRWAKECVVGVGMAELDTDELVLSVTDKTVEEGPDELNAVFSVDTIKRIAAEKNSISASGIWGQADDLSLGPRMGSSYASLVD